MKHTDTQNERQHVIHCDREQHNQSKSKKQQREMPKCKNVKCKIQKCKNAKCKNAMKTKNIIHKSKIKAVRESHSKYQSNAIQQHTKQTDTQSARKRKQNKNNPNGEGTKEIYCAIIIQWPIKYPKIQPTNIQTNQSQKEEMSLKNK
jgi:hypothetical protein